MIVTPFFALSRLKIEEQDRNKKIGALDGLKIIIFFVFLLVLIKEW